MTTCTPCLQDLVGSHPDLAAGFARCQFLVLDEADRLLESSFEAELRVILQFLPPRRQTLLFSATMTRSLVGRCWLSFLFFFFIFGTETAQNTVPRAGSSLRAQVGSRCQCSLTLTCVEDRDYSLSSLSAGAAARRTVSLAIALGVDGRVSAGTWPLLPSLDACCPTAVSCCAQSRWLRRRLRCTRPSTFLPAMACHGLPWPVMACHGLQTARCGVCWRA